MLLLPPEVNRLVDLETQSFKDLPPGYIVNNYIGGPTHSVCHFKYHYDKHGKPLGVKLGVFNEACLDKQIVKERASWLGLVLDQMSKDEALDQHLRKVDCIVPICFSDKSDVLFKEIPALAFSKASYSNDVLIPTPNQLMPHMQIDRVQSNDQPFHLKQDLICFVGSLTGSLYTDKLLENPRVQVWKYGSGKRHWHIQLHRPPKWPDAEAGFQPILDALFELDLDMSCFFNNENFIDIPSQLQFKYQITVDGHSCAWSRLPWQMAGNCVPIKVRNPKVAWREWFYPLLDSSKHFVECDLEDVDDVYNALYINPDLGRSISENGKDFVKKYYNHDMANNVLLKTLLNISEMHNTQGVIIDERSNA